MTPTASVAGVASPRTPQQLRRRPSVQRIGSSSGVSPVGTKPSPRMAKLLHKNSESRASAVAAAAAAATGPVPPNSSDTTAEADSATFLTAVGFPRGVGSTRIMGLTKARAELRPPSPLEAVEPTSDYGAGGSTRNNSEPVMANYVGSDALQSFWGLFHRQDTVAHNTLTASTRPPSASNASSSSASVSLVLSSSENRPRSARTTYLSAVRRMRLSPEPMGIVRRRGQEKPAYLSPSTGSGANSAQEVNLSCYRMGDAYASAFSQGFALIPGVESLNLAHNRISDKVAAQILRNAVRAPVPIALQSINFSHNALASSSVRALSDLLRGSKTLTALNLSHNELKDRDLHVLCEALQKNQTLTRLHLSENKFGIAGMVSIAKFLEENAKIEEVYLSWNQIRGLGALKIVEALKFHASLRALDLSWNALDSNELLKPRSVVSALADALANNKVLAHLDISNNHLDLEDCALLAKQLESNQTLIGLHMIGNCGTMDSRGYLIPKQADTKLLDQHKMYSIAVFEESHSETGTGSFPAHLAQLVDKFCWYCGQWSEYRFAWTPTSSSGPFAGSYTAHNISINMSVRLHLSLDDWRGIEMDKRDDGSFSAYRILPPGKTEYFLTVADRDDPSRVSYHYVHEKSHTRLVPHIHGYHQGVFGDLSYINIVRLTKREGRDPCNALVPRSSGKSNDRRAKWDINKSVFARRRRESVCRNFVDTDSYISKACSADWRQCKIDRFIKDPLRRKEVETCVMRHYRLISNVYRHFCGHGVLNSTAAVSISTCTPKIANQLQNDIISVPWSGYVEFVNECRILDEASEFCKMADLENVFVAANLELTQEAKEKDNPDRSLTRFEFLECVTRIAINKYCRTNICDSPVKAVEKLIQEHLMPNAPDDANDFRTRFLYTEEVSDIFSEYIVVLQDVYNSNMGKYCKVGEKKGMQLAEFLHVMERYQVYCDSFRVRDVKDPFLACKLIVLDEMATAGHKKLFMTDFMELLLRVSVIRYPPKPFVLAEVAKSLQKLFLNHFAKHECILDSFRDTVDQALLQDRIEAFASAINSHKHEHGHGHDHDHDHDHGDHGHGHARARPRGSLQVLDDQDDDSDDDDSDDDDDGMDAPIAPSIPAHMGHTTHGIHISVDEAADEPHQDTP